MYQKIFKIIFWNWKKYFIYVFLAVILSLFSYILSDNIVLSVNNYLKSEIKPLVWWDLVLTSNDDLKDKNYLQKYDSNFEVAKTISINSTIFDNEQKPTLVDLVYSTQNYPFYNRFSYDIINTSWSIIVDKKIYEKYWWILEILSKDYMVKGIITTSPIWNISIYSSSNSIYLPITEFDNSLNSQNSRIEYTYYLKTKNTSDLELINQIKNDVNLKTFRKTTLDDRNENIANITDRFYVFINFFNLVVFVLTFFIVILSLESYFKKIKSNIWLLNIFWLSKKNIFFYNFIFLLWLFLLAFLWAFLLNYLVFSILWIFYNFFEIHFSSFLKWIVITFILLVIGIFLPFFKIFKSNTLDLLNDSWDFLNFKIIDYLIYLGLIFFWFLVVSLVSNLSLLEAILYSFLFDIIIVLFYIILNFILKFIFLKIEKNKTNFKIFKDFYLFDAIRSTIKPGNLSFLIVFSSIISFLSIFIFLVFSWSFLNYLQNLTTSSRDMFVLNVQEKNLPIINKYFKQDEIFEIVSLKISKINDKSLKDYLWVKEVWREFSREFFSTTNVLDNKILSWEKLSSSWVSVDAEFGKSLNLKLWDKITFSVAWLEKTLTVVNFREAVRNWVNPFFYFNLDKKDFEKYPKNYILSYKQSQKIQNLESILHKEITWNLTFIDAKQIIDLVVEISKKILWVVYLCLSYIFLFSFLSFVVCIGFLRTFKIWKIKILHILGWDNNKLFHALHLEYIYLIFIAFLLSIFFWSLFLFIIFYFIKYFSLYLWSYIIWILVIFMLFFILISYLLLQKNHQI